MLNSRFSGTRTTSDAVIHLSGLAMLLSTAVQLRFGFFGVGELAGLAAVGLCLLTNVRLPSQAAFFLLSASLVCVAVFFGATVSLVVYGTNAAWLDYFGMIYAFLLSAAVIVAATRSRSPLLSLSSYLLLIPVIQVLLFASHFFLGIGIPIWFADEGPSSAGLPMLNRFVGWAAFPNQLGIVLAGLPFVVLIVWQQGTENRTYSMLALVCTAICALLILSNTVFVAWLAGLAAVLLARGAFSVRLSSSRGNDTVFSVVLISLMATLALVTAVFLVPSFFEFLFVKGDDADLNGRLPLWSASIEAWLRSPVFGLGPGSHALVEGEDAAAESHLLFLDVLTQGGFVALLALLGIFVWSFRCAVRARSGLLIGLVVAVSVEALAHNTQRHPVFWLYLVLPAIIYFSANRLQKGVSVAGH